MKSGSFRSHARRARRLRPARLPFPRLPSTRLPFGQPASAGPPVARPRPGRTTGPDETGPGGLDDARPRRSPRGPRVITAMVLVGVLALTALADVVVERTARDRIARAAACKLRPSGAVSARIGGAFAGLRLLTGDVGTVRISARDVRRDGIALTVAAELHDVTTKGATSGGWASATVGYGQLGKRLGSAAAGLAPGPDGAGGLVLTGRLAGIPLPITVHTRLTTTPDTLTVTPWYLSLFGENFQLDPASPNRKTSSLARRLAPRTVRLPGLPAGVRLTGARATGDGIVLTLVLPRSDGSAHSLTAHACDRRKP